MKKSQFKDKLFNRLVASSCHIDHKALESAMNKLARHMNNTTGVIEWDESQLGNAECFYHEYGKAKTTFNQAMYRGRNSGTSRY